MSSKKAKMHFILVVMITSLYSVSCGKTEEEKKNELKQLVQSKCTMCHFSDRIFKESRTESTWDAIVNRMRAKNPDYLTVEETEKIKKYLQENVSVEDD